jgi:hypothetical protein
MSTPSGGTKFVLKLWRSAFGGVVGDGKDGDGSDKNEDINTVASLDVREREYVASWVCHLASTYPFVGVVHSKSTTTSTEGPRSRCTSNLGNEGNAAIRIIGNNKRKDIDGGAEQLDTSASSVPVSKKRSQSGVKKMAMASTTTITTSASDSAKNAGGSAARETWLTMRFHLRLGMLQPCVLPLRVQVKKRHRNWWFEKEEQRLKELSMGIHANSDRLFDAVEVVNERAAGGVTISLTTLSFSYQLHLREDAESFDGSETLLTVEHDTGRSLCEMMLPCYMTCSVSPLYAHMYA